MQHKFNYLSVEKVFEVLKQPHNSRYELLMKLKEKEHHLTVKKVIEKANVDVNKYILHQSASLGFGFFKQALNFFVYLNEVEEGNHNVDQWFSTIHKALIESVKILCIENVKVFVNTVTNMSHHMICDECVIHELFRKVNPYHNNHTTDAVGIIKILLKSIPRHDAIKFMHHVIQNECWFAHTYFYHSLNIDYVKSCETRRIITDWFCKKIPYSLMIEEMLKCCKTSDSVYFQYFIAIKSSSMTKDECIEILHAMNDLTREMKIRILRCCIKYENKKIQKICFEEENKSNFKTLVHACVERNEFSTLKGLWDTYTSPWKFPAKYIMKLCLREKSFEFAAKVITHFKIEKDLGLLIIRTDKFYQSNHYSHVQSDQMKVFKALILNAGFHSTNILNLILKKSMDFGHKVLLKFLVEDTEVDCTQNENLLFRYAARRGYLEVVKALLGEEEINPSVYDNEALIISCSNGHTEIVRVLVADERVDVNSRNGQALVIACETKSVEIVKILFTRTKIIEAFFEGLRVCCKNGCLEIVELLLIDEDVVAKKYREYHLEALSYAIERNYTKIISAIIKRTDLKIGDISLEYVPTIKRRKKSVQYVRNFQSNQFLLIPIEVLCIISSYLSVRERITVLPNISKSMRSETNFSDVYWISIIHSAVKTKAGHDGCNIDTLNEMISLVKIHFYTKVGLNGRQKFSSFVKDQGCIGCLSKISSNKPLHVGCNQLIKIAESAMARLVVSRYKLNSRLNYDRLYTKYVKKLEAPVINQGDLSKFFFLSGFESKSNITYVASKIGKLGWVNDYCAYGFSYDENRFKVDDVIEYFIEKYGNARNMEIQLERIENERAVATVKRQRRDVLRRAIENHPNNDLNVHVKFHSSLDKTVLDNYDHERKNVQECAGEIITPRKKRKAKLVKKIKQKIVNFDFERVLGQKKYKNDVKKLFGEIVNGTMKDHRQKRIRFVKKLKENSEKKDGKRYLNYETPEPEDSGSETDEEMYW